MAAGLGGGVRAPIQIGSGGERERANEWGRVGVSVRVCGSGAGDGEAGAVRSGARARRRRR